LNIRNGFHRDYWNSTHTDAALVRLHSHVSYSFKNGFFESIVDGTGPVRFSEFKPSEHLKIGRTISIGAIPRPAIQEAYVVLPPTTFFDRSPTTIDPYDPHLFNDLKEAELISLGFRLSMRASRDLCCVYLLLQRRIDSGKLLISQDRHRSSLTFAVYTYK
jgi:hypothetical protein